MELCQCSVYYQTYECQLTTRRLCSMPVVFNKWCHDRFCSFHLFLLRPCRSFFLFVHWSDSKSADSTFLIFENTHTHIRITIIFEWTINELRKTHDRNVLFLSCDRWKETKPWRNFQHTYVCYTTKLSSYNFGEIRWSHIIFDVKTCKKNIHKTAPYIFIEKSHVLVKKFSPKKLNFCYPV